jgi:hypothetical protein
VTEIFDCDADPDRASQGITNGTEARPSSGPKSVDPATDFARCFLRLANLPSYPLDRLTRYEAILWHQAAGTFAAPMICHLILATIEADRSLLKTEID